MQFWTDYRLTTRKAGGFDGIVSEHLLYSGPKTVTALTWVLNCIIQLEYIPQSFRYGIAIPLFKQGKESTLKKDNYRKITLLTTFCKLFESVTLKRAEPWLISDNRLSPLQGAAIQGCSCLHTSLILRETAAYQQEGGHNTIIAFLDARKAFDAVWVAGLFHKLYELGIDAKLWRLLYLWYSDLRCSVRIGTNISEQFQLLQGGFRHKNFI